MRARISHLVNSLTRQALYETVPGYVRRETDFAALEQEARTEYGISSLLRFDLGENPDGPSPRVRAFLDEASGEELRRLLSCYPENTWPLRETLAALHGIPPPWISLGPGVDFFISTLCHTFCEWGDRALLPTPTFFVIEEYLLRSGALPICVPAHYDEELAWTARMTAAVLDHLRRMPLKMLWLCAPNNPSGQAIPLQAIEAIVRAAEESFTIVAVDEAYGEYTDDLPECGSAAHLLERFENLIVLRSFSKAYGLAGMRVGYAMMSSRIVHDAAARQMEYFPVTGLSLELARIAAQDQDYLEITRQRTRARVSGLREAVSGLEGFECLPSQTNTVLCRHRGSTSAMLREGLLKRGILVSSADVEGLRDQGWVRVTCHAPEENAALLQALRSYLDQAVPDARNAE